MGRRRRRRRLALAEWCFLAALTLLIFALGRPRRGDEKIVVRAQGIDMIFALDMSGSMSAYDLPGNIRNAAELKSALGSGKLKNRLDTAKEELARFIAERPNDRIGLIGFAEFAYSFVPPTLDHDWLSTRLGTLEPGQIGDGTGIASPIVSAANRLKKSDSPRRVLVLFTDGADNVAHRVTPEQAAQLAKECDVVIHTVGIGGDRSIVADGFGRLQWHEAGFDEALLRRIAAATGGEYFHAGDAAGMRKVMEKIDALERTEKRSERFVEYCEYAPLLTLLALALVGAAVLVAHTWKLHLP